MLFPPYGFPALSFDKARRAISILDFRFAILDYFYLLICPGNPKSKI
jgi:hypothetical protein